MYPSDENADQNDATETDIRLWNSINAENFSSNLDINAILDIELKLDELSLNQDDSQIKMDDIATDIACLLKNGSKQTFGTIKHRKTNPNHYSMKTYNLWFNRSCKSSRDMYHKTRKAYNKHKNHIKMCE